MPRSPRILLPDTAHHIVQRGYNRRAVFHTDSDYDYYLENLVLLKNDFACEIYAYCLMSNHVHLLINPGEIAERVSMLMKHVAARQTIYVNRRQRRSGTLWEGRFKSSVVLNEKYLTACCRYIELNPVRAAIISNPAQYRWSSYASKISAKFDPVVDFPTAYLALGTSTKERREEYARYVCSAVPDAEIELIREAVQKGRSITSGSLEKVDPARAPEY